MVQALAIRNVVIRIGKYTLTQPFLRYKR